ncbi:MAG: alpha/beta hydrolase [Streptosporangiales bacterium]|nr:alpha/beta hydrolase [Streptosporangiales bacterium]
MRNVPGHGKQLSYYQFGSTSFFASAYDQRFSYCLYVPHSYSEDDDRRYQLVVAVHGTGRMVELSRELFADFCERHDCIVLAPLFPCGIDEPGELSNYKFIEYRGIRYDEILLAMVDEISSIWRVSSDRFMLHGFSGGGHFTHRFAYLHPERLLAISVGSPGVVTLLDFGHPWWVGVADVEERFGRSVDLDALRRVAVHMVVGADDTATWEITIREGDRLYQPGVHLQGDTRIDRIRSLARSFEDHGIAVQLDLVPGVSHELVSLMPATRAFFRDVLAGARPASISGSLG